MFKKAKEGWDVVLARRVNRSDSLIKRVFSKLFYGFFLKLTLLDEQSKDKDSVMNSNNLKIKISLY